MHTGGMMNAGQAPYQKAANDECRICGGTHTILILFFLLSRMDRKFIQSLTFNVILLIITIITHISQALVTGKRSYIESRLSCCCCCVCCHCFSSGVKIKREREREKTRELSNFDLLLGKHSFCCVSVECETARSFVRNVDVAPFHQLSSSSLL